MEISLSPDDKRELEIMLKSRGWEVANYICEKIIADSNKKIMQNPQFDARSEEAIKMMEETSSFAKMHKMYSDTLQKNTLFVHTPNV